MELDRDSKNREHLREYVREAPLSPGVYLWKDEENRIIYVGKARLLKNRLSSYFSRTRDVKTAALMRHSRSIETIMVSNEYEALLLENTLIKQHSPKYNISLKDGKTYPVVRISTGDYPRIFRTRFIVEDGSLYFGPFANIQGLDRTMELIEKLFPLRKCRTLKKRNNPCMYYHIGRCLAPCCGKADQKEYAAQVERVRKLLDGESSELIKELHGSMNRAAQSLRYEEAADIRNAIRAIEGLNETNSVIDFDGESRDYIAWAEEGIFTAFSVLSFRGGRMTGQELYSSRSAADEDDALETFISAYYDITRPPPPRVYLPKLGEALQAQKGETEGDFSLLRYFEEQFGSVPEFLIPSEKRHLAAIAMAHQNAQEELRRRLKERGAGPALEELQRLLNLKKRPERMEGFDVSHLGGKYTVASLISFKNGIPDRKNYRHYKLKTLGGKIDDYAAITEVVKRRYSRLLRENLELPDLILIDGGLGQANAAQGVIDELGLPCEVAALAERNEDIWLPGQREAIKLSKRTEALKVLQHLRDETHRFARILHTKLRTRDLTFSLIQSVEGIGPKRGAELMKIYGSVENIAQASPADIAEKIRISETAALSLRSALILALEDRNAKKPVKQNRASRAAALADIAAEDPPKYPLSGLPSEPSDPPLHP